MGGIISKAKIRAEVVKSKEIVKRQFMSEIKTKAKGGQLKYENREGVGDWRLNSNPSLALWYAILGFQENNTSRQ